MDRTFEAGTLLIGLGVLGYVAGIYVSYPGRAFSVTAVMVGITLVAISDGRLFGGSAE